MADITTDPLTAVYNELVGILLDSDQFASAVKEGSRIVYTGVGERRDPEKENVQTADFPECRVAVTGFQPHLQRTSCSSSFLARYAIEMRSGSKALDYLHFPMVWAVYRAMVNWATRLTALTWNGDKRFVVLCRPVGDVEEDIERTGSSRGIEGWYAIWNIEIEMFFDTAGL